jgi:DHA2 family methylenomycin A resistance protein-like MFS transporter
VEVTQLTICLGYFLVILDTTVLNVGLPAIRTDLGGGVPALQWVVDGYGLTFAALLIGAGVLGDRTGPRRCFQAGLLVFAGASALGAAAPTIGLLIAARAVQGVGAALLVPTSLALLAADRPDPAQRARALGTWGAVAGTGAACGPLLGGLLVGALGWRSLLALNVPFALVALALTARLPAPSPTDDARPPAASQAATVGLLAALTFAIVTAGERGIGSPGVLGGLALGGACAVALGGSERRATAPLLPRALLRHREVATANVIGLLMNLGFYGQLFVINLLFQQERGLSALQAALALLPEAAFVALGSVASGRMGARWGPRVPLRTGLTLATIGLAGLAVAGPSASYAVLVLPLIATGLGMSLTMPAATALAIGGAPSGRAGTAGALLNAARQVGGLLGVAVLGAIVAAAGFGTGLRIAMLTGAAAFAAGLVVSLSPPARTHASRRRTRRGAGVLHRLFTRP